MSFSIRPLLSALPLCTALLAAPALSPAELAATVEGREAGETLLVIVPEQTRVTTDSLADQLARLELDRGTLLIHETPGGMMPEAAPDADIVVRVAETLVELDRRDRMRLPVVESTNPEAAGAVLMQAVTPSFAGEDIPALTLMKLENDGETHVLHLSQADVPLSRRTRWGRTFVQHLLQEKEMTSEIMPTAAILRGGERAFAMYDCEGVGGSGPDQILKIFENTPMDATVTPVTPVDVREGVLENYASVLFPGGSGKSIANALQPEGQELVRAFIDEGGGYTGICAGAYLASNAIDGYLCVMPAWHNQPWAKGGGMVDVELTEDGKAILGEEFAAFETRYNNGPVFVLEDQAANDLLELFDELTPLAHFRSAASRKDGTESAEMIDTPAILATTYGNGRVLSISPHPETHDELFPMVARGFLWAAGLDVPEELLPVKLASAEEGAR